MRYVRNALAVLALGLAASAAMTPVWAAELGVGAGAAPRPPMGMVDGMVKMTGTRAAALRACTAKAAPYLEYGGGHRYQDTYRTCMKSYNEPE
jgi:hypothetical protein